VLILWSNAESLINLLCHIKGVITVVITQPYSDHLSILKDLSHDFHLMSSLFDVPLIDAAHKSELLLESLSHLRPA
jgi:hypothetical protein